MAERGLSTEPRVLSKNKRGLGIDVLTAAQQRISRTFDEFPVVYVSFSGGKDSGVMLELAAREARKRERTLGVLIVDLEGQYQHTIDFIATMLTRHADVVEPFWVCLPLNLRNAVSQFQPHWQCWDTGKKSQWIRPLPPGPGVVSDPKFFDFFERGMEFEDFVPRFGEWYSTRHGGKLTACLVGIRADESLNRYRTIANWKKRRHQGLQWTTWVGEHLYNVYPLYDWRTEDIWRFNGKEKVPYNKVYDLMHQAGLSIHQARLCQPYGDDQRKGLWLFHIIEPETWSRVVSRVQGANFGAIYATHTGNILGRVKIEKPENMTWQQYATALLASMPPPTADHFRDKIAKFLHYYEGGYPGGVIPDDGPMTKDSPSWKRICKALLSYDFWCKGLSFSPPLNTRSYQSYKQYMRLKREVWGYDRHTQ
ncbi:Predicted phosphoadenosine phosphosulfate sulfotransferase [Mycobacteroides abscessus subsp. massiliense]|uniref:phosphoadenosine phosphosulfate reductase n=1 Tax=Mycobacteroides TaxID=670516 RepID=UPI00092A7E51|nr:MULTISPECIES: DUF3440 domain-containing protein [Mycobacteroides]MBV0918037.1 DUF3440 domain-containing protein [Mycobacteroides chelonae]RIT59383.1 DUF3440 domain-containing protein [Mycobacteroides abscessus]RIU52506.1 DUF3440 domain-containing protein [Mycobacteroides abscessus]SHX53856.1 Predicted phosphoadenosine phosphosulfate sulfotransferase [Mycobacteroides abscessus subsp. abscessus]SKM75841.1 Predicted phosphoadenosine phosphosulfate sulfotransferase [Mycobacteroides abscessus su